MKGDEVDEFQPLCEVQSDKASVEITSRYKGKVNRVLYIPGDIVKVCFRTSSCLSLSTFLLDHRILNFMISRTSSRLLNYHKLSNQELSTIASTVKCILTIITAYYH